VVVQIILFQKYSILGELQERTELQNNVRQFCKNKKLYPQFLSERKTSSATENYSPDMVI